MVLLTEEENIVDEKTVCALGLFDGVHLGHRLVIGRAAELAKNDMKTAVFTFDSETVTSKGRLELLLDEEEKRRKISELGADYIYSPDFSLYKDLSAEDFVRKILVVRPPGPPAWHAADQVGAGGSGPAVSGPQGIRGNHLLPAKPQGAGRELHAHHPE